MQHYHTRTIDNRYSYLIPAESSFAARQAASARTRGNVPYGEFMATPVETRTTSIPFTGFYCSSHSDALDHALESMFSDDRGDPTPAYEIASDAIAWRQAYHAYAALYAENLANECAATWEFAALDSPRFYNFRSDEIDVIIGLPELQRMREFVSDESLAAIIAERLEPHSGFIPFYSDKLADWPSDLSEWESPQLSLLIECYCNEYCDSDWRAWECVDDYNGELSAIIRSAIPADAWERINDLEESQS